MPSSASASAPEPPAVAESSSRWRGCRLKADWGWSLPWGLYRIGSRTTPSLAVLGSPPASGGVWSSGAKNEKGRSRWNGIGLRGADGNRNHDLFDANEALYQLSYSPLDVTLLRKATRNNIVRSAVKRNLTPKCRTRVDTVTFRCRRRGKSPTPLRMDTAAAPGNVITSPARPAPSFRCRTRTRCRPSRTARPRTRRRCGSPRRTPCRWWRRR